jgi:hypothetical protein
VQVFLYVLLLGGGLVPLAAMPVALLAHARRSPSKNC